MGQVTLNARATVDHEQDSPVSPSDHSDLNILAGTDIALVASFVMANKTMGVTSVVWDPVGANQALTLIGGASASGATGRVELWGLFNPVIGNKILRITFTGTADSCDAYMWALNNVDQGAFATTFVNFGSRTATASGTISDNASGVAGDWAVDGLVTPNANISLNTQTLGYINNNGANSNFSGSDNNGAGGTPWSFGWTLASSNNFIHAWATITATGNVGAVPSITAKAQAELLRPFNMGGTRR